MVKINVTRGKEALNLCRYVLQPEKIFRSDGMNRELIDDLILGNMVGSTPEYLAKEFWISQSLKPRVKVNIVHYTVSFPPGEDVDDLTLDRMSRFLLEGMGHSEATQFFAVRHFDQQHKNNVAHFHVVASTIGLDRHVCKSSWDWLKREKVEREVEIVFGLSQHPTQDSPRYITTGEHRQKLRTGKITTKERLWELIDNAAIGSPEFREFSDRLIADSVELRVKKNEVTGEVLGLSYGLDGMAYTGRRLGKRYTLRGVREELGVRFAELEPPVLPPVIVEPEPKGKKRSRGFER